MLPKNPRLCHTQWLASNRQNTAKTVGRRFSRGVTKKTVTSVLLVFSPYFACLLGGRPVALL